MPRMSTRLDQKIGTTNTGFRDVQFQLLQSTLLTHSWPLFIGQLGLNKTINITICTSHEPHHAPFSSDSVFLLQLYPVSTISCYYFILLHLYIYFLFLYPVTAGLGTAFFYVLNASFCCILLKNATFFYVFFRVFGYL